jgi:hypothetical protein
LSSGQTQRTLHAVNKIFYSLKIIFRKIILSTPLLSKKYKKIAFFHLMFIRIKLIATFQVGLQISDIESSRNPAAENLCLLDEVGQEVTCGISR